MKEGQLVTLGNRRLRRAALATVPVLAIAVAVGFGGSAAGSTPSVSGVPADIAAAAGRVLPAEAATLAGITPLPTSGLPAAGPLLDELMGMAASLDVPLDRATVADELDSAGLSSEVQATLTSLVAQLATCSADTDAALGRTPHEKLAAGATQMDPADAATIRGCAVSLRAAVQAARPVLSTAAADGPVRVWPLLAFSPGATDDTYLEDYALSIDQGGNDTYLNNQGSNQLDLKRSLTSPVARYAEPARGCRMTYPDSVSGRINDEPGPNNERQLSFDGPECVPVAALLWDMGGDDTYGEMQKPTFPDNQCSTDPSVARFTTIGAGVEGVAMVIEDGGNDTYLGKTGTMGAGHLGGVGLLEDRAGDDHYLAIRNGQGLGLLGGTGVLRDDAGNDDYDYYMPRPLDEGAPFQTDGSGGVVDDSGLLSEIGRSPNPADGVGGRCDDKPRSLQGVGQFVAPAFGVLIDRAGDDTYRAAGYENQEEGFPTQTGTGLIRMAHGSQGAGFLGGVGVMLDLAGLDTYLREQHEPAPDRHNGMLVGPQPDLTFDEVGSPSNGRPLDLSVFFDAE